MPTDDEWRQSAKYYGGVSEDAEDKGKAAYQALLAPGKSGFNAVRGDGRSDDGQYARVEAQRLLRSLCQRVTTRNPGQ